MEHLVVSTDEIALVYVAIIAGGISAYSASIAKKNGGMSPTWSISLVLLAASLESLMQLATSNQKQTPPAISFKRDPDA